MIKQIYDYPLANPDSADLLTAKDFKNAVKYGMFIDYDGYGRPVKEINGVLLCTRETICPSRIKEFPEDATHIEWYNR